MMTIKELKEIGWDESLYSEDEAFDISLKNLGPKNKSLLDRKEYMNDFLQDVVFKDIASPGYEPYDDNSIICYDPVSLIFVDRAREALKLRGYKIAVFKHNESSNEPNLLGKKNDFYIFAYAKNKVNLKGAFNYINENENYTFEKDKSNM